MDHPKTYGYERRVKISSWDDWIQSDPLGDQKPHYAGGSHYRTLGQTDEIFMPKTSTQEHLESGLQRRIYRTIAKKQLNYESYPLNDLPLDSFQMRTDQIERKYVPTSTTYDDDFKPKMPMSVREDTCKDEADPLLNRIPKCGLKYIPSSENKFMDDQLAERSENRKKIDFFRQIRNSSKLFR